MDAAQLRAAARPKSHDERRDAGQGMAAE